MVLDGIEIKVDKKRIKNIYIRIKPPAGDVVISAPLHMRDEDIYIFAESKLAWIKNHRRKYEGAVSRRLVSGEKLYLWGNPYTLVIKEGRSRAETAGENIIIYVPQGSSFEQRQAALNEFYRRELLQKISELAPLWEQVTGLFADEWRVRDMQTRWGSCNTVRKRIWLSLKMAPYPVCCLEYVIVHELCHLLVPNHGADFKALMDRFCPEWKKVKRLLNGGYYV